MSIGTIKLTWGDQSGVLSDRQAFLAAEAIEAHITLFSLGEMMSDPTNIRATTLARAYSAVLRVAGVTVHHDDIWRSLLAPLAPGQGAANTVRLLAEVNRLFKPIWIFITNGAPLEPVEAKEASDDEKKETPAS